MNSTTPETMNAKLGIRPLEDRVVIKRDEENDRTSGGIVLPDSARGKINRGKVVAVGDGKLTDEGKRVPLQVKLGDQVLFGKFGGDEIEFDEQEYLLIREGEILAVLE